MRDVGERRGEEREDVRFDRQKRYRYNDSLVIRGTEVKKKAPLEI